MALGIAAAQFGIGALGVLQAKSSADALKRQGEFRARQAEFNSQLIQYRTQDIHVRASTDIEERSKQVNQMIGSQKASLAGQGIEVEGELGEVFEQQEREVGMEDILTIKNNAWAQSLGLEIDAQNMKFQSRVASIEGKEAARQTLTTGGLSAASQFVAGARSFRG